MLYFFRPSGISRVATLTALLGMFASAAHAEDKVAAALAESGAELASRGMPEKARDIFFKALVHDPNCGPALFELGRLYENDGRTAIAAAFFSRAIVELKKNLSEHPEYNARSHEAQRRLTKLNPYDLQLREALEGYSDELTRISKRWNDTLTALEALERTEKLELADRIAPEKLPKINKPAAADAGGAAPLNLTRAKGQDAERETKKEQAKEESAAPLVPTPEIERLLKATGWTRVFGGWKKKSDNVYEVTNGRIEADITYGVMQFSLRRGHEAVVKALVRCTPSKNEEARRDGDGDGGDFGVRSGYGFVFKGDKYTGFISSKNGEPSKYYTKILKPLNQARDIVTVKISEECLALYLNGVDDGKCHYKMPKSGSFVIAVEGTATLELPCAR